MRPTLADLRSGKIICMAACGGAVRLIDAETPRGPGLTRDQRRSEKARSSILERDPMSDVMAYGNHGYPGNAKMTPAQLERIAKRAKTDAGRFSILSELAQGDRTAVAELIRSESETLADVAALLPEFEDVEFVDMSSTDFAIVGMWLERIASRATALAAEMRATTEPASNDVNAQLRATPTPTPTGGPTMSQTINLSGCDGRNQTEQLLNHLKANEPGFAKLSTFEQFSRIRQLREQGVMLTGGLPSAEQRTLAKMFEGAPQAVPMDQREVIDLRNQPGRTEHEKLFKLVLSQSPQLSTPDAMQEVRRLRAQYRIVSSY